MESYREYVVNVFGVLVTFVNQLRKDSPQKPHGHSKIKGFSGFSGASSGLRLLITLWITC